MVVGVALAVADILHQPGRRVEDGLRRHQRARLLRPPRGALESNIGGIRFRRRGEVDDRLGERQFALGRAQEIIDVLGRKRLAHGLGVGKPDVLVGHAHHAPGDVERVLARFQHAGQPVE